MRVYAIDQLLTSRAERWHRLYPRGAIDTIHGCPCSLPCHCLLESHAQQPILLFGHAHPNTIRQSPRPIQTISGFKDSVSAVEVTGHEVSGRSHGARGERTYTSPQILGCSIDGSIRRFDVRAGKSICDSFPNAVRLWPYQG